MSYKRVVEKKGKRYGPYVYESYRDKDGKVKKRYLGKFKESPKISGYFLLSIIILLLFAGIGYSTDYFLYGGEISGRVIHGASNTFSFLKSTITGLVVGTDSGSSNDSADDGGSEVSSPDSVNEALGENENPHLEDDTTTENEVDSPEDAKNETEVIELPANVTVAENQTENISEEIINSNASLIDAADNDTLVNESLPEEINKSLTETSTASLNSATLQYKAVINRPVKWITVVNASENKTIELPKTAANISILTGQEIERALEQIEDYSAVVNESRREELASGNVITGNVVFDIKASEGVLSKFWRWVKGFTISGKVIFEEEIADVIVENGNVKIVDLEGVVDEDEIAIEYMTPGPVADEIEIAGGKRIVISAEDKYTDILAYTLLDNFSVAMNSSSLKLYWYATYEDAVKYGYINASEEESVVETPTNESLEEDIVAEIPEDTGGNESLANEPIPSENTTLGGNESAGYAERNISEDGQDEVLENEIAEAPEQVAENSSEVNEEEVLENNSQEVEKIVEEEVVEEDDTVLLTGSTIAGSEVLKNPSVNLTGLYKVEVDYVSHDFDSDGFVDYIEWVVPHLSIQVFDVVVGANSFGVNYVTGQDNVMIEVTAGADSGNISTFVDFDNSLVSWWRMEDPVGVELVDSDGWTYGDYWSDYSAEIGGCSVDSGEEVSQDINIVAGKNYNVSFYASDAAHPNPSGASSLFFSLGGVTETIEPPYDGYVNYIITAVNTDGIKFWSTGYEDCYGMGIEWMIDYISVEEVGAKVTDNLGRNNGTAVGNAARTDGGKMGKAFSFDGVNGHIDFSDSQQTVCDGCNFTISVWVYKKGTSGGNNIELFGSSYSGSGSGRGYSVAVSNNDYFALIGNSTATEFDACGTFSDNMWVNIVSTFNGTDILCYVNGVAGLTPQTITMEGTYPSSHADASEIIGAGYEGIYVFNGSIDDVMVWNRSLSASEVAALYANNSSKYLSETYPMSEERNYTFTAYAQDTSGAVESSGVIYIEKDVSEPSVTINSPINGKAYSGTGINFNAASSEAGTGSLIPNLDDSLVSWWRMDDLLGDWMVEDSDFSDENYWTISSWGNPGEIDFGSPAVMTLDGGENIVLTREFPELISGEAYYFELNFSSETAFSDFDVSLGGNTVFQGPEVESGMNFISGVYEAGSSNKNLTITVFYDEIPEESVTFTLYSINLKPNETTVIDFAGRNNGSIIGNAVQTDSGHFGKAFSFDGDGDCLSSNLTSPIVDDESGTVALWFRTNELDDNYNNLLGLSNYQGDTSYLVINQNSTGSIGIEIRDDGSSLLDVYTTEAYNDGQWHFAAFRVNEQGNVLYIDGNQASVNYIEGDSNTNHYFDAIYYVIDTLSAGCVVMLGGEPQYFFNGSIDDVMLFNRSLSADEILALYNATAINHNTPLGSGSHEYVAYSQDVAGNVGSSSVSFDIDLSSPILSFVEPTPVNNASLPGETSIEVNMISEDSSQHYSFVDFDGSLVGWWRAENDAADESDEFLSLDGSGDYVEMSSQVLPSSYNFSYGGWVNLKGTDWGDYLIMGLANYEAYLGWGRGDIICGNPEEEGWAIVSLGSEAWHHVMCVQNESSVVIYVDGVPLGSSGGAFAPTGTSNFVIGSSMIGWNGSMDNVMVFNKTLSAGEVSKLYEAGRRSKYVGYDGLVSAWLFDSGDTVAKDSVGTNDGSFVNDAKVVGMNDGTFVGNAGVTESGRFGKGFSFDGSGDYISVGNSSAFNLGIGDFAISAWFKMAPVQKSYPVLLGKGNALCDSCVAGYAILYGTNNLRFVLDNSTATGDLDGIALSNAVYNFSDGNWHQVAGMRNSSGIYLFVDGVLRSSGANNLRNIDSVNPLRIGSHDGSDSNSFWNGSIDEVMIFNRSLSASEIAALYNATANQYYNNFTNLSSDVHTFVGYGVDAAGNKAQSEGYLVDLSLGEIVALNSPPDGSVSDTPTTLLNATVKYIDSPTNVSFYVSNGSEFDEDNLVCKYYGAADDYLCNFTTFVNNDISVGRVAYLRFNNWSNGEYLLDSSGNGNHITGVYSGAEYRQSGGAIGGAYHFDGADDYLRINYSSSVNLYNNLTISVWAKRDSSDTNTLLSRDEVGYDPYGALNLYYRPTSVQIEANNLANNCAGTVTYDNEWHHIAATILPNRTARIYYDGAIICDKTIDLPYSSTKYWMIGRRGYTTGSYFNGSIDEIMLYNRALHESEIRNLYLAGQGEYYWKVNISEGHESDTNAFIVDLTDPVVTLNSPADGGFSEITMVVFNYSAYDHIGVESCTLWGNFNGTWAANQTNWISGRFVDGTFNLTLGDNSTYIWNVECNDSFNHRKFADSNRTLYVGKVPPFVKLVKPANNSYGGSNIMWSVVSPVGLNATCNLSLDGWVEIGDISVETPQFHTEEIVVYPDQLHDYYVTCWNEGDPGKSNTTDTYYFTSDTVVPGLNITNPSSPFVTDANVTIGANASDDLTNVSLVVDFDNSLISWWRMDDFNESGGLVDYMGRNNGTLVGEVSHSAGYFGNALEFYGNDADGYVNVSDSDSLDFGTGDFAIAAWVNRPAGIMSLGELVVYKKPNNFGFNFFVNGNGLLQASINDGANVACTHTNSPHYLNDSSWHHMAAVWDRDGNLSLYVDGEYMNGCDISARTGSISNTADLEIGRGFAANTYFNGSIDDVMIFNRILSAEQIRALYTNSSSKYYTEEFYNLGEGVHSINFYTQDQGGNINSSSREFTVEFPKIGLSRVYPLSDILVGQNKFFKVSVNVSCSGGNCGEINVSLDPLEGCSPDLGQCSAACDLMDGSYSSGDWRYDGWGCYDYNYGAGYSVYASNECYWYGFGSECVSGYYSYFDDYYGDWFESYFYCPSYDNSGASVIHEDCYVDWEYDPYGLIGPETYFDFSHPFFSGRDVKSGLISTEVGVTPFYTNESNPRTISLNDGQSQVVNFWVNATGDLGGTFEFFAFANRTLSPTSNITSKWNVTIVETDAPLVEIVYPMAGTKANYVTGLNYSYSDANPGYCWYFNGVANSSAVAAGINWSNLLSVKGANTWTVYCNDSYGNMNSSSVSFTVDDVNPLISYVPPTPENNSLQAEDYILVNVTSSDSVGNVSTFIDFDNSLVSWWRMDDSQIESGYEVSGAGTSAVNGVYFYAGTFETRSYYKKGSYYIYFDPCEPGWVINNYAPDYCMRGYYVSSVPGMDVPTSGWTKYEGLTPAPAVSRKELDVVVDYTGRNNGTIEGDAAQTLDGKMGKAFSFDGNGDYINFSSQVLPSAVNYSYGGWVNLRGTDSGTYHIMGLANSDARMFWDYGDIYCAGLDEAAAYTVSSDTWYHVMCIQDELSLRIYLNGNPEGEFVGVAAPTGASDFIIGTGSFGDWNGSIDDVMIFNRSLSAEEMAALYANSSETYLAVNYTNLSEGNHTFKAYVQDNAGNVNSAEKRDVNIDEGALSRCKELNVPNSVYTLQNNITTLSNINPPVCFNITANNVTLDLNGYTVKSEGFSGEISGTAVKSIGFNDITIRNGNLGVFGGSYWAAINLSSANGVNISNVSFFNYYGLVLESVSNSSINNVSIGGFEFGRGIYERFGSNNNYTNVSIALSGESTSCYYSELVSNNQYYNFACSFGAGDAGVYLNNSNNNLFVNLKSSVGVSSLAPVFLSSSSNNIFVNLVSVQYMADGIRLSSGSINNTFVNWTTTAPNLAEIVDSTSQLIRKWYYDVAVNGSGTYLEGANVSAFNVSGALQFSELTNSTGRIERKELVEYVNNGGTRTFANNYTMVASKEGYVTRTRFHNLTTDKNILDVFILTENVAPNTPVVFINSTDGTNRSSQDLNCFANITDSDSGSLEVIAKWYKNGAENLTSYQGPRMNGTAVNFILPSIRTAKGENWSCSMQLFDGQAYSEWGSSSNLTVLNTPPTVTLISPANWSATSNRTPEFSWSGADSDGDTLTYEFNLSDYHLLGADTCSDGYYESSYDSESFVPPAELKCLYDNGYAYVWSIRAYDGEDYGQKASGYFNISAVVNITLVNSGIYFGNLWPLDVRDTDSGGWQPFIIQNDGNAVVNVSVNSSALWITQPTESSYYQFKADNVTQGAFNWNGSVTDWLNMPITGNVAALNKLNYTVGRNAAEVDIKVEVPASEPVGAKTATVIFAAGLDE